MCDCVKAVLDDACLKHILALENSANDGWLRLADLTTADDKYYANSVSQKRGFATSQNQMSSLLRPNQNFAGRGGFFGIFGDTSPRNTVGFGAKPCKFGSVRRCFECNSPDHIRANCPRARVGNNCVKSGNPNQAHRIKKNPQAQSHKPSQTRTSTSVSRVQSEQIVTDQFDTRTVSDTKIVDTAKHVL